MSKLLPHILLVLVPLLISNTLHMWIVKRQWLPALNIPVWEKGFGANKTWRGFFFLPLTNGLLAWVLAGFVDLQLQPAHPFVLGYAMGVVYLVSELPNSFFKRKVGIAAGSRPEQNKALFFVLDKTDSALGVTLAYYFLSGISIQTAVALFVVNSLTHMVVSIVLFRLKLKSSS